MHPEKKTKATTMTQTPRTVEKESEVVDETPSMELTGEISKISTWTSMATQSVVIEVSTLLGELVDVTVSARQKPMLCFSNAETVSLSSVTVAWMIELSYLSLRLPLVIDQTCMFKSWM